MQDEFKISYVYVHAGLSTYAIQLHYNAVFSIDIRIQHVWQSIAYIAIVSKCFYIVLYLYHNKWHDQYVVFQIHSCYNNAYQQDNVNIPIE